MSGPPQSLADWLSFIEALHPKGQAGIELGLDRVLAVKAALGQRETCRVITVGGTNGKGSTCAYLETILTRAGHRVGCYASPHLLAYNERVRIDARPVDDAALCRAFGRVEAARAASGNTPLTYFEFGTLAAWEVFAEAGVDVAVLEVGLGGRLDAVNAYEPDAAVVTGVALDHTDWLGPTREHIGREKAGIFRARKPALCADPAPPESLLQHAAAIGADLRLIGRDFGFERIPGDRAQWRYWVRRPPAPTGQFATSSADPMASADSASSAIPSSSVDSASSADPTSSAASKPSADAASLVRRTLAYPGLRGNMQLSNASVAVAALDALRDKLPVTMQAIRQGLIEAELPGRFQILPGRPTVILDVAHNPQACAALAANLGDLGFAEKTIGIVGMLADKDIVASLQTLLGRVDHWLVIPLDSPRAAPVEKLVEIIRSLAPTAPVESFADAAAACRRAAGLAGETDRIAAFGSFLTVAAVHPHLRTLRP